MGVGLQSIVAWLYKRLILAQIDLGFMMYQGIQLIGIIVAGLFVSPYILLASLFLSFLCLLIAARFLPGAREVKRLESNTKSPIYEQFRSALAGIGTIRSFGKVEVYVERYLLLQRRLVMLLSSW